MKEPTPEALVARLKDFRITGVSVKGRQFIDQRFVDGIKSAGIRLFVWTINEPDRIRHYAQLGVDGIITDNPAAGKYILEANAERSTPARP